MKVAVIGADSEVGKIIVKSCECRGIQTVCMVEELSSLPGEGPVVIKAFADLKIEDFAQVNTVIDPLSFFYCSNLEFEHVPLLHLLKILEGTKINILALGSASLLYSESSRQKRVCEEPFFQEQDDFKVSKAQLELLKIISQKYIVPWTMLCPPLICEDVAHKSGHYEFSDDVLPMGADGSSVISNYDLADAVAELLKRGLKPFSLISVRAIS